MAGKAKGTIGATVKADGEEKFIKAVDRVKESVKTLGTEAKLVASKFDAQDKSVEALTARNEVLNKQIEKQKEYVSELSKALDNAKEIFGEDSVKVEEWQQKLNKAQAALNVMNRELKNNTEEIERQQNGLDDAADAAKDYTEETGKASKASQAFSMAAKGTGIAIGVVTAAVAACTAAAVKLGKAFVSMTTEGATYADTVLTQATVTGIATDKLQEYMYAAELVDVSTETLTGAMAKNIRSMNSAREGSEKTASAYGKLGVSVTKRNGELRDSEEVFMEVVDALGKVRNETERDALAMEIFGKSAQELNPLIVAGSGALAKFAQQARDAGAVLDEKTLKAYGKLDDQLQRLKSGAQAAKNALGQVFLPVLTSLATDGVDALGRITRAINDANGDVTKISENVSAVIPEVVSKLKQRSPEILAVIKPVVSGVLQLIAQSAPQIVKAIGELIPEIGDSILDALPELLDTIGELLVNIAENLPIDKIVNIAATAVFALIEKLPRIIVPLLEKIPDVITAITKALTNKDNIDALLNGIIGVITATLSNTPKIVNAIVSAIPEIISAFVQEITSAEFITNTIKGLGEAIGEIIFGGIKSLLTNPKQWIQLIKDLLMALNPIKIIKSISDGLADAVVGTFSDAFGNVTETSASGRGAISGTISGNIPGTGGGMEPINTTLGRHLRNQNALLQKIADKETVVTIGDDAVGQAQQRYNQSRGRILNKGVYANAY